jgi:hypothetical protein
LAVIIDNAVKIAVMAFMEAKRHMQVKSGDAGGGAMVIALKHLLYPAKLAEPRFHILRFRIRRRDGCLFNHV